MDFFVHESSYIDDGAIVGQDTKIWHFSHVQNGACIGSNCILGQNVNIGPGSVIGNSVKIQNNVSVYSGVVIEDNVFVGPSAVFTNVKNPRAFIEQKDNFKKTIVKKGSTIGANATIVGGVTIGKYAFIAAGSVVTKDVGDYEFVCGVPAVHKGFVNDKGDIKWI